MVRVRRGNFPNFVTSVISYSYKGTPRSRKEGDDDTYCEQLEGCVGNESIADGEIPFCHELVLRYWVTLQIQYSKYRRKKERLGSTGK